MVGNNKTISTLAASPSAGLQDGTDAIHSGIIKGLESFAYDRMIIEHAGFAINTPGGATLNTVTLSNPIKYMFDGKMHTYGSDLTCNTVAAHGTHTRYDWVVLDYNSGGTPHIEIIQGTAASTPKVADFNSDGTGFDRFIPVALIAMVGGSDNGAARSFKMYTLDKNDLSVTIADDGASAGTIVKAHTITSSSGTTTFHNHVDGGDIYFKVRDNDADTTVMRMWAGASGSSSSTPLVAIYNDHASACLQIESSYSGSGSAPDVIIKKTGATSNGHQLGVLSFQGKTDESNNMEYAGIVGICVDNDDDAAYGSIVIRGAINHDDTDGPDGQYEQLAEFGNVRSGQVEIVFNESSADIDFRVESDGNTFMLNVDAGKDAVGIGVSPDDNSALTVEGAISLDEISAPTATANYGKLWTQTDNNMYFQDGAGQNRVLRKGGKHTIWVPAAAMYPETTNGCSSLTQVELSNGPELKCLDFADGADDHAQFTVAFPKSWNEGTITFEPFWTVTGTNTGTVAWGLSGTCFANDATINTAFSSPVVTVALAHSGTSNDLMKSAVSGNVTIQNAAADTLCIFRIMRDISADTQTGSARLLGIKLYYTVDAGNDE